jgi:hypothetical protein
MFEACSNCGKSMEDEYLDPLGVECDTCYDEYGRDVDGWMDDDELDLLDIGGEG